MGRAVYCVREQRITRRYTRRSPWGLAGCSASWCSVPADERQVVEPVEKVKVRNLQKKRLLHLTYKRRSRVGRPFRYPKF